MSSRQGPTTSRPDDPRQRADALLEALDRLPPHRFVELPGLAAHAPMAAEALSALGAHDRVLPWVDDHRRHHPPLEPPPQRERLDAADATAVAAALGDPSRLLDWSDLFSRALGESAWPDVVGTWVPRLLPGYAGAFTHGLLRTAHAVRLLDATGPEPRALTELADGLAYWAATSLRLPGRPRLDGPLTLAEALGALPRHRQRLGPEAAASFAHLRDIDGYVEAVEALGPQDPAEAMSTLTATFAGHLVAHPEVHPFAFVHAVTPVAAARALLPHLPPGEQHGLVAALWQVEAAIAATFLPVDGDRTGPSGHAGVRAQDGPGDGEMPGPDELAGRAAEHGDTHVVKFTEACLREHRIQPDSRYLHAAHHLLTHTPVRAAA